jgi:hypothetical protein
MIKTEEGAPEWERGNLETSAGVLDSEAPAAMTRPEYIAVPVSM